MITEKELYQLKRGDKVLVECTVEAVFVKSGMVMVTTRDCDKGFDAYEDEVIAIMPDKATNRNMLQAIFSDTDLNYNGIGFNARLNDNNGHNIMQINANWLDSPYKKEDDEE